MARLLGMGRPKPQPMEMRRTEITISDLIVMCNERIKGMGVGNPNRELLFNCAMAMRQLADRVYQLENPAAGTDADAAKDGVQ